MPHGLEATGKSRYPHTRTFPTSEFVLVYISSALELGIPKVIENLSLLYVISNYTLMYSQYLKRAKLFIDISLVVFPKV